MDVSRTRALRGPNLWSRHTAIECIFACDEAERDINRLPGFEARLRARFPAIDLNPPTGGRPISLAHVQEAAALSLQVQAGCTVTFSLTKETVEPGTYQVVVEYGEEPVGRLAFEMAEQLIRAALDDTPFDIDDALFRLKDLDGDVVSPTAFDRTLAEWKDSGNLLTMLWGPMSSEPSTLLMICAAIGSSNHESRYEFLK